MAARRIFWGFCINRLAIGPLHYISSRSDFWLRIRGVIRNRKTTPQLAESGSRQDSYRYNFFKSLNKSMVIVHSIPGLFFAKLVL
jgi:hypothetical protein